MTIMLSYTRISLLTLLALAVIAGVLALIKPWERLVPGFDSATSPPVFDISQPGPRHAAEWLASGTANFVEGRWLGSTCTGSDRSPGETFVLSRTGPRVGDAEPWWREETILLHFLGGTGTGTRKVASESRSLGPNQTRTALDIPAAAHIRQAIDRSGLMRMVPDGEVGFCHAEVVTAEYCSNDNYYGVVRLCPSDADWGKLQALLDEIGSAMHRPPPAH